MTAVRALMSAWFGQGPCENQKGAPGASSCYVYTSTYIYIHIRTHTYICTHTHTCVLSILPIQTCILVSLGFMVLGD